MAAFDFFRIFASMAAFVRQGLNFREKRASKLCVSNFRNVRFKVSRCLRSLQTRSPERAEIQLRGNFFSSPRVTTATSYPPSHASATPENCHQHVLDPKNPGNDVARAIKRPTFHAVGYDTSKQSNRLSRSLASGRGP